MTRPRIDDEWKDLPSASARCWARRRASGKCQISGCELMPDGARTLCRPHLDAQNTRMKEKYHANQAKKKQKEVGNVE